MINYCTHVEIPISSLEISYKDRLMFLGSCFAENIGIKTVEHGWDACVNPFGVLFNPLSVASGCRRLLNPEEPFTEHDLFEHDGMFHSFKHHGKFSGPSVTKVLTEMNKELSLAADCFRKITCLLITFGTASVYRLKSDGRVVANCHKLPATQFERELLTVGQIVEEWSDLLDKFFAANTSAKVIFTVSPVRYWKDGAHGNQLSKSVLLLAEQALTDKYAGRIFYFPAYELMMDELRDYRFYADDLLHPSKIAIDYIWERFCETYMNTDTKIVVKEVESVLRDISHRPFQPSTDHHKQFLMQTLNKIKRIKEKNPYICIANEENEIISRLQGLQ
jgi:hypothetical protein